MDWFAIGCIGILEDKYLYHWLFHISRFFSPVSEVNRAAALDFSGIYFTSASFPFAALSVLGEGLFSFSSSFLVLPIALSLRVGDLFLPSFDYMAQR